MNHWRTWALVLSLLAGNALAGQEVRNYFVGDTWNGTNEASLPHYHSPEEACIVGVMQRKVRGYQEGDTSMYRYIVGLVGQDDGGGNFECRGEIQKASNQGSGGWLPVEVVDPNVARIFGPSESCALGGFSDPGTGQCGQPKHVCCADVAALGDKIDAASGNKHQTETDYAGAGASALRFGRTYDGSRTWLNNPVPIGIGWTHAYLASVAVMPTQNSGTMTEAVAYRPDGSIVFFNLVGGVWTADPDVALRLSVAIDGAGVPFATLTDTDDAVEHYDQLGRLVSITSRDGFKQTLSYTTTSAGTVFSHNDVQQVSDPQGRALMFGYNASLQLKSMTDANGATTQFNYDANHNLASVTYPDLGSATKTRTYSYNEAGQVTGASWPNALTGITDENGQRFASWWYDSDGRATQSVHAPLLASGSIDKTTLVFNADGTTTFTDALGQVRTYGFNVLFQVAHPASLDTACDGCVAHDKARSYDSSTGYTTGSTDFNGNQTQDAFAALDGNGHPRGLETQRIEGIATDTSAERTTTTQWSPAFRVPTQRTVQDHAGTTRELTNWIYNARGQATFRCMVDPTVGGASGYTCGASTNAPNGVRQWAWTYCEGGSTCPLVGLLLTAKGPRTDLNDTTAYTYYQTSDQSGCAAQGGTCHLLGDLQKMTNALGQVTTYQSYDKDGRPTRTIDPNLVTTDLTYHPRGWLTSSAVRGTNNGSINDDQITAYSYDGLGQVLQATLPTGNFRGFIYDAAHRLTDVTNRFNEKVHYTLDAAGNRTVEDSEAVSGTIRRKVLRSYDALGRLHVQTNAADHGSTAMTYLYDGNGNVQQLTDGRSHIISNTYDSLNRLHIAEQDVGGLNVFTNYTHDAMDRLTVVQDPQGLPTSYNFDALGNQTSLASPDTKTTIYGYDAAGNRTSQQDARPVTATYGYDALNRLTGITYPTSTLNVGYGYDISESGCPVTARFPVGHLTHFTDGSGSTQYCYDRFGNMVLKSQTTAGGTFGVTYSYDKDGHLLQTIAPRGTVITDKRDLDGRISSVTYLLSGQTVPTTVVSRVTYDSFGPIANIACGNGRAVSYTYDLDYVISKVLDPATGGLSLTFGRDAVRNLIQVTSSASIGDKLLYDGLNRLTGVNNVVSNNPVWTYTYDGTGNRTSKQQAGNTAVAYTYDPASHHLLDVGVTPRQYDPVGNTLSINSPALSFVSDDTGRMNTVKTNSVVAKLYQFNARGERVRKTHPGFTSEIQTTVYDETGHVLGDFDNANNIIREYIWLDNKPVGVLIGATPTLAYVEPDHLGSPRVAVDATSNLAVWTWPLVDDPFGETTPTNLNGSTLTLNLRLPGQVFDAESGLRYNYFRDYDATTGRYIESDPAGLAGGSSTYGYAGQTPLDATDFFRLASGRARAQQAIPGDMRVEARTAR